MSLLIPVAGLTKDPCPSQLLTVAHMSTHRNQFGAILQPPHSALLDSTSGSRDCMTLARGSLFEHLACFRMVYHKNGFELQVVSGQ